MATRYLSFPDYTTSIGKEIRAFLTGSKDYPIEARHMLYSINRLEHKDELERWMKDGATVVINRYCESNLAYGAASGLSIEWLRTLESMMPQADYVFYLRATSGLSKQRKKERDKFEGDIAFLNHVSSIYDVLAENPNWFTIEADDSVNSIQCEISKTVEKLLLDSEQGRKLTYKAGTIKMLSNSG